MVIGICSSSDEFIRAPSSSSCDLCPVKNRKVETLEGTDLLRDISVHRKAHAPLPVIKVEELLAGRTEVVLIHEDEPYRLRITARGKLILTK